MTGRHLILCLVLVLAVSSQASAASIPIIVQLTPTASLGTVLSFLGGTVIDTIPGSNQYLLNVPGLPLLQSLFSLLGIQWIETNTGVTLLPVGQLGVLEVAPTVTGDWYKTQPALQLLHAQQALTYSEGRSVVVADINSQVDVSHPALRGHLTSGYDFVTSKPSNETALNESSADFLDESSADFLDESSADFLDESSADFLDGIPVLGSNPAYAHGTLCAGLIAAVAPDAMIMPLRAFDAHGSSSSFMLAKAIRYAVDHGAEVINMSFGTLSDSKALRSAIDYARQSNVVLVASAGNSNSATPQYPAAYSGVITVAATDLNDVKASFSNYGHDVVLDAPGVNIVSAYPGGLYSVVSGTSFSAPMVAGAAALIRSLRVTGITSSMTSGAVNIYNKNPGYYLQLGSGRIDILKAIHP